MIFEKIRWKNFLSYGNNWTEFNLNDNKIIGISGINGSGKSVLLCAMSFVTTGKTFRKKIKKSQIMNTRNKKNCLVEIFISYGNDKYVISRGINPDIFTVKKNKVFLDEDSHVKDFQKIIEQIFRFNPIVLKNTIFMSSMDYKPFLLFSAIEKREYIEDILNLHIFSDMIDNLKIKLSLLNKEINNIDIKIQLLNQKINTINEINKSIEKNQSINEKENIQEIKNLKIKIKKLNDDYLLLDNNIKKNTEIYNQKNSKYLNGLEKNNQTFNQINNKISLIKNDINNENQDIQKEDTLKIFFNDNLNCNTCQQKINLKHKTQILSDIKERIKLINENINNLNRKISFCNIDLEKIKEIKNKINLFGRKNQIFLNKINNEKKSCIELNNRININKQNIKNIEKNFNKENENIKNVEPTVKKLDETKKIIFEKNETQKIINLSKKVLSDKGIKLFIINKYIPILNKYVNKYLDIMSSPYRLNFNNELQEQIILRGYENLSYHNLSSGEKQRCDLALLFSFIKIAKLKNSFDSNLLILDEIIDNSMDKEGIMGVIEILKSFKNEGKTIFIISHRDEIKNLMDKNYEITKKIFSKIEE